MDLFTPVHLVIILAIALLLFGPKRLPEIGQGLGKTLREFRKAMKDGGDDATETQATSAQAASSKEENVR